MDVNVQTGGQVTEQWAVSPESVVRTEEGRHCYRLMHTLRRLECVPLMAITITITIVLTLFWFTIAQPEVPDSVCLLVLFGGFMFAIVFMYWVSCVLHRYTEGILTRLRAHMEIPERAALIHSLCMLDPRFQRLLAPWGLCPQL